MNYSHPKIYIDLLTLFKLYYLKHKHLPKMFRVTIGDDIMKEVSACIKLVVFANFKKDYSEDFKLAIVHIRDLRGRIELIKSYVFLAWDMKFISYGFYAKLIDKISEISKQATSWEKWMTTKKQIWYNKKD